MTACSSRRFACAFVVRCCACGAVDHGARSQRMGSSRKTEQGTVHLLLRSLARLSSRTSAVPKRRGRCAGTSATRAPMCAPPRPTQHGPRLQASPATNAAAARRGVTGTSAPDRRGRTQLHGLYGEPATVGAHQHGAVACGAHTVLYAQRCIAIYAARVPRRLVIQYDTLVHSEVRTTPGIRKMFGGFSGLCDTSAMEGERTPPLRLSGPGHTAQDTG